jgi:hypothetical protein
LVLLGRVELREAGAGVTCLAPGEGPCIAMIFRYDLMHTRQGGSSL